jgi:hypothetical protein
MADKKISALDAATTPLAGTEVLPIVQSSTTKKVSVANLTAGRTVAASSLTTTGNVGIGTTTPSVINGFTYPWVSGQVYSTSDALFIVNGGSGAGRFLLTGNGAVDQRTWGLQQFGGVLTIAKYTDGQSPTTSLEFTQDSNVKVNAGNLIVGTSGKGIDFSATSNATGMTSELLADYEEGTWTPTIEGTGTAGTATYATNNGRYTRVGRQIFIEAYLAWSDGSGTGNLIVKGLPFQAANSSTFPTFTIIPASLTTPAGEYVAAYIQSNATYINIMSIPNSGNRNALAYDAAGELMISGIYTV